MDISRIYIKKDPFGIYLIRPGVYALGTLGEEALAIVKRTRPDKPGRPTYRSVRGRLPTISCDHKRLSTKYISSALRTQLHSRAGGLSGN